jgi:hypothetical protein
MFVFFLWSLLLILIVLLLIYRLNLTSKLEDFTGSTEHPLDACTKFNRGLLAELCVHTVITICFISFPNRSYIMFALNFPMICRAWWLYSQDRFYFSPFQIHRDAQSHTNISMVYVTLFVLSGLLGLWKVFMSLFFY